MATLEQTREENWMEYFHGSSSQTWQSCLAETQQHSILFALNPFFIPKNATSQNCTTKAQNKTICRTCKLPFTACSKHFNSESMRKLRRFSDNKFEKFKVAFEPHVASECFLEFIGIGVQIFKLAPSFDRKASKKDSVQLSAITNLLLLYYFLTSILALS